MSKPKYNPAQVEAQLLIYLEAGGKRTWESAARALGMPTTSLKVVTRRVWPDGGDGMERVEHEGIGKVVTSLKS